MRLTVQVLVPAELTLEGVHDKAARAIGTAVVMEPPVAEIGMSAPAAVAPIAFVIPMEVAVVPTEIVAVTTATAPS